MLYRYHYIKNYIEKQEHKQKNKHLYAYKNSRPIVIIRNNISFDSAKIAPISKV